MWVVVAWCSRRCDWCHRSVGYPATSELTSRSRSDGIGLQQQLQCPAGRQAVSPQHPPQQQAYVTYASPSYAVIPSVGASDHEIPAEACRDGAYTDGNDAQTVAGMRSLR
jgi:hypothetical protein